MDEGLNGIESHHWSFKPEARAAVGALATSLGLVETGGTDYHGDFGPPRSATRVWPAGCARGAIAGGTPPLIVPPARPNRARGCTTMCTRMATRSLPVLDLAPPVAGAAGPRDPFVPEDARLEQFRPEARALPSFFVWTLGCQMNKSDSEEMAGRLLAAGCAEAVSMDAADLVVINTCAIREAAEAKVIGRQGHLNRLKAANPGLRVVMTGCSVREPNRAGLARRYPAVDVFLRPDEEPELVDRWACVGTGPRGRGRWRGVCDDGATTLVHGAAVSDAAHLVRARADAIAGGAVSRHSAISAWLPIIYGCDKTCTYCIVPFSRGPERSRPFDEIVDEARALAAAGCRRSRSSGRTSTATATTSSPSHASVISTPPPRSVAGRIARAGPTSPS